MNHPGRIPECSSPSVVPWGNRAHTNHLHLESLYQASPLPLPGESAPARGVSLVVDGWLGQEAVRGRLIIDSNVCEINDFGDRAPCTRVAARSFDVALTRLRASDPEASGRTLFAITGAGIPDGLLLVMYPYGDRVYLKLDDTLVPLYFNDGPPPPMSTRRSA